LEKLADALATPFVKLLSSQEQTRRLGSLRRLAQDRTPDSAAELLALAESVFSEPRLKTRFGLVDAFGPAELIDTIGAPAVHEGDRYYLFGEVCRQKPVSALDEMILDLPPLECARFEIIRQPDLDHDPFAVTVLTRAREQTRVFQKHWRSGQFLCALVRVVVVLIPRHQPDRVAVTNLVEGGERAIRPRSLDGNLWSGFEMIGSVRHSDEKALENNWPPQPWVLLVEDITEGPRIPGPKSPRHDDEREEMMRDLADERDDSTDAPEPESDDDDTGK